MPTRIVRFTDVDSEWADEIKKRIEENDGPPEGVISTGVKFFHDADQRTAVVVQEFDSQENMETSEKVLEALDTSDTPGNRVSVDRCELVIEASA